MVSWVWLALSAIAADGTSEKPPPPPMVDLSAYEAVRPPSPDGKPHPVAARLVLDQAQVAPGGTVRAGVLLEQAPGWHTYWQSPGAIGLPTTIAWTLPEGVSAAPHAWPIPQRFEADGMVSYGYDDAVLLFSEVQLPPTLSGSLTLSARVDWLVCETSCIPGGVDLRVDVPVGTQSPSPAAALFDHFAAQHPAPAASAPITAELTLSEPALRANQTFQAVIALAGTEGAALARPDGGAWPTFAPIVSPDLALDAVEVHAAPDGRVLAVLCGTAFEPLEAGKPASLGGLLQTSVGGAAVRTELTFPVAWAPAGAAEQKVRPPIFDALPPSSCARAGEATAATPATLPEAAPASAQDLPYMLAFAFFGGVLLNVMPCVFPVLLLKLFGLVGHGEATAATRRRAAGAYTAGILVSFVVLAGAVIALKSTVEGIGWGFQFQSPAYVATLATIVFAFGLSLFGVFEVPAIGADSAAKAADRDGILGDFLNGVFAVLVATPCTAPFLGSAVGYAFAQSAAVIVLFFATIGLGLAAPFVIVTLVPALYGLLPQPGAWMDRARHLMGFSLIATTIWMVDILAAQLGPDGAIGFLAFLASVGVGAWVFGQWGGLAETGARQLGALSGGVAISALGGYLFLDLGAEPPATCDDGAVTLSVDYADHIPWQGFTEERLSAVQGKAPIFVDFTADWCLTCKVNERTVLETEAVREALQAGGYVALKADWTRRDPYISAWLAKYQRAGVPFYLVIPTSGTPTALPEVITPEMVTTALAGR